MNTTETSITQPATKQPENSHRGVIRIADHVVLELAIDRTDTQGDLRDQGVFKHLHAKLLLPENYAIIAIFYEYSRRMWNILVESSDLPDCNAILGEDAEYPRLDPMYCREPDGTLRLVEIKVHIERTVPVLGGLQWLLKAL